MALDAIHIILAIAVATCVAATVWTAGQVHMFVKARLHT